MNVSRVLMLSALTMGLGAALFFGVRSIGQRATEPQPDLTFASFASPASRVPYPGEVSELEILVKNLGPGILEDAVDIVAFAADPRGAGKPARIAAGRFVPPLASGELRRAVLSFTAPDYPGPLDLYFAIDPDGDIAETSRENNVLLSRIHVGLPPQPTPDLVVSSIRFDPPAPRSNQDILVVAEVSNQGDASTVTTALLDLYINDPLGPMDGRKRSTPSVTSRAPGCKSPWTSMNSPSLKPSVT